MPPLLTVGLPFRDSAGTLADAIRSVFAQTFEDWELLLVDDGSTDGSLDLARRVDDPRVRAIADGVHRGLAERLNRIAALARGTYLARMDADDLMHPERLERQVECLAGHPEVDVVGTAAYVIDEHLHPFGLRGTGPLDARLAAVLRHGLLIHPSVAGRSAWFRHHPYDPAYVRAEDHELWCRTCAAARFAKLDEPLHFYRQARLRLEAYLASCRTDRRIVLRYGPAALGWPGTLRLAGACWLKGWCYGALAPWGAHRWLARRRGTPLAAHERERAAQAIAAVRATRIPGLDR